MRSHAADGWRYMDCGVVFFTAVHHQAAAVHSSRRCASYTHPRVLCCCCCCCCCSSCCCCCCCCMLPDASASTIHALTHLLLNTQPVVSKLLHVSISYYVYEPALHLLPCVISPLYYGYFPPRARPHLVFGLTHLIGRQQPDSLHRKQTIGQHRRSVVNTKLTN